MKEKIAAKDFDYVVVKNTRRSALEFEEHNGREHVNQSSIDAFTNDLFYRGKSPALH